MKEIFYLLILILSISFGTNMKLADCFNEHGFKWFKGDGLFFGILFGLSGGLLIYLHPQLTNLYLALLMVNILRFRVDRLNHGVAATIMFFSFLLSINNFNWNYFIYFFLTFAIFGLTMDLKLINTKNISTNFFLENRIFYFIFTLIFSIYTQVWIVFISMFLFQISYNITSRIAQKNKSYIG